MQYKYYAHNVMLMGMMGSGKTHDALALVGSVPKENVVALDTKNEYAKVVLPKNRVVPRRPYNVDWLDETIALANAHGHAVVIFDDADLFISHDKESRRMADFLIDSRHFELASILILKRCVDFDARILQAQKYFVLHKGCLWRDVQKIQEDAGIDAGNDGRSFFKAYMKVNESPLDQHLSLLVDNDDKSFRILKGLSK